MEEHLMLEFKQWQGFTGGKWCEEISTRDFIQKNYTAYDGDESFLAAPTDATNTLWAKLQELHMMLRWGISSKFRWVKTSLKQKFSS